jgi:hypothetical protein
MKALEKVDYGLLSKQKLTLVEMLMSSPNSTVALSKEQIEALHGILNLLDEVTDEHYYNQLNLLDEVTDEHYYNQLKNA